MRPGERGVSETADEALRVKVEDCFSASHIDKNNLNLIQKIFLRKNSRHKSRLRVENFPLSSARLLLYSFPARYSLLFNLIINKMLNNKIKVDFAANELYNNILYFTLEKRESLEHLWAFRIDTAKFNNDFEQFCSFCKKITKEMATELNKLVENRETLLPILQYTGLNPKKREISANLAKIVKKYAELGLFPLKKIVKYNPRPLLKNITGYTVLADITYSNRPRENAVYEHPRTDIVELENKVENKINPDFIPLKRKAPRKRQYTKRRGPSTNNKYFTIDTSGTHDEVYQDGKFYTAQRNGTISELLKDL